MSTALHGLPAGWVGTLVPSTGSTNADLAAAGRSGAPHGTVLAADEQTAGRGRLGRRWVSPAGTAVAVSVLLRPPVEESSWTWLPLLAGLAVTDALRELAPSVATVLKWPNDVLTAAGTPDGEEAKLAGILSEHVGPGGACRPGVVVGIGLNVTVPAASFPPDAHATSLAAAGAAGAALDRDVLLRTILAALHSRYAGWTPESESEARSAVSAGSAGSGSGSGSGSAGPAGDAARDYRARCGTIGRRVRVQVGGGGATVVGVATGVAADGALLVAGPDATTTAVHAGDVHHLRGIR